MKNDKRVVKTNRIIKEAFLKLLSKKKYSNITIQDIANEAFINRNTFYLHFVDKEDLLEKYTDECLDELLTCIDENIIQEYNEQYLYSMTKNLFDTIEKNTSFYRIMMIDNNSTYFTEKLAFVLEQHIFLNIKNTNEEMQFYVKFLIRGFIGVIRWYLENDNFSSVKLSRFLFQYVNANPYSLIVEGLENKAK